MKTIIALSTALLLSFTIPAYAGNGPVPVGKKDRHEMMTKKKNKKHNKKNKKNRRLRRGQSCDGMIH